MSDKRKVLFVATIDGHIRSFHIPYLRWFKEQGWETCVAANSGADAEAPAAGQDLGADVIPYCDHKFNIDIQRSPFDRRNLRAYQQLKRIFAEIRFDIVHSHTPMGGVLGRLAARKYRRRGTASLYTAHGFHFYKGAPKSAWLVYYPVEKFLSRCTDALITINREDYELAKHRLHARRTFITHGVGYDSGRFFPRAAEEKKRLREEFGYGEEDILLIYVAELSHRKNQRMLLHALKKSNDFYCAERQSIRLLLVGPDSIDGEYQRIAEHLGIDRLVDFLGYRRDADKLVPMCDIALASSKHEGLPVNVMEAMACGLPVVATDVRGNRDLIENGRTGYIVRLNDADMMADRVRRMIQDAAVTREMGKTAADKIIAYSALSVAGETESIYLDLAKSCIII
jgi:glycosyltransferase EpsD